MWGKGLRTKTKKYMSSTVHVNYIINIQEIKPWPPSQSLKSIRSVVLQWENGLRSSGFTHPSSPLDSKIEFNESFMLQVSFSKDTTGTDITTAIGTGVGTFETNLLEFSLYEPKKENPRGKLIGSGLIDLADYGVLKEAVSLNVPIGGAKKSWKGGSAPVLCVKIQPLDRDGSSSTGTVTRERDGKESGTEYETESEVEMASFTDDEIERGSSHSSLANSGHHEATKEINGGSDCETDPNGSVPNQETLKEEIKPITDKEIYEITPGTPNTLKLRGLFKDAIQNEKQKQATPDPESQSQSQSRAVPPVLPPRFSQTNRKMSFAGTATGTGTRRFFGERTYSTLTSDMAKNLKLPPIKPNPSPEPNPNPNPSSDEVKDVHMQENPNPNPEEDEGTSLQNPIRITSNASRNVEKIRELEARVELLEGELRDAAAVEIGLYSIVPDHASSAHKVHTPARRLARLYIFAIKNWSKEKRAKAARSISSALVLVMRSCGNDVQRLVYWLSNTVVLRTIIRQTMKQSVALTSSPLNEEKSSSGSGFASKKKTASLWESVYKKRGKLLFTEELDHWANPGTLVSALEKTESWIFSRILESIWWQIFMPHMQSAQKANETQKNSSNKRIYGKVTILGDQKQANLSIEIWKKAFKDASEKLCPIRACGHECGCLPILARLVMEQCVARLDVAMFNAILRQSDDEVPTDPLSDPITDPKILPIPHGKSSFGAGVQLKNAIGSWSRFLTDLFGMDTDESSEDLNGRGEISQSFVPFRLLNALSDLLMLPKDMLLETSIRKEVCPTFSSSIIKRVLDGFITDEFCPDPISEDVLNALDSKDHVESGEVAIRQIPCNLSPMVYSLPSIALVESIIGDVQSSQAWRSGSSIVRKSYYSDDELEELNSPLTSVIEGSSNRLNGVKKNYRTHAVRYQLLHEIWKDGE